MSERTVAVCAMGYFEFALQRTAFLPRKANVIMTMVVDRSCKENLFVGNL